MNSRTASTRALLPSLAFLPCVYNTITSRQCVYIPAVSACTYRSLLKGSGGEPPPSQTADSHCQADKNSNRPTRACIWQGQTLEAAERRGVSALLFCTACFRHCCSAPPADRYQCYHAYGADLEARRSGVPPAIPSRDASATSVTQLQDSAAASATSAPMQGKASSGDAALLLADRPASILEDRSYHGSRDLPLLAQGAPASERAQSPSIPTVASAGTASASPEQKKAPAGDTLAEVRIILCFILWFIL